MRSASSRTGFALVLCGIAAMMLLAPVRAQDATFKVASWNMRGGSGIAGQRPNPPFYDGTGNCTDRSKPLNAWGVGFTQPFLAAAVKDDPAVVAMAGAEAWGCAQERNLNAVLGFKSYAPGRNGTVLLARYGIQGTWDVFQIEQKGVGGMTEPRYLVGAEVCVVPDCSRTLWMWATHLSPATDAEWPAHITKVLSYLATKPTPHLLMGDFNFWRNDRWSPVTNCGRSTDPMARAWQLMDAAGYVDAWKATQPGEGWTGMQSRRGCGEQKTGDLFKRIDYIMLKGAAAFTAAERFARVPPGAPAPSDHVGLKATVQLPPRR